MTYILIIGHDSKSTSLPLLHDLLQTTLNLSELIIRDDARLGISASKRNATKNILFVEILVVTNTGVVLVHQGIDAACGS